jgi:hypothetical protein
MLKRTFVIGDVHGHVDRLVALLDRAGLPVDCHPSRYGPDPELPEIIQLGDLGNFGFDNQRHDAACYELAHQLGMTVLWGNHDRAIIEPDIHGFRGFVPPQSRIVQLIQDVHPVLAVARHGYLLTHAGLHPDHAAWAAGLTAEEIVAQIMVVHASSPVVTAASTRRGGMDDAGGILWRDASEPLFMGVPQVFGHTRGDIRKYDKSYCIDTGGYHDGNLAGIWLPEMKIVAVGPDADEFENQLTEG